MTTINQDKNRESDYSTNPKAAGQSGVGQGDKNYDKSTAACSHGGIHKNGECNTDKASGKQRSEFDLDVEGKKTNKDDVEDTSR